MIVFVLFCDLGMMGATFVPREPHRPADSLR
jgi:hypothetical protein